MKYSVENLKFSYEAVQNSDSFSSCFLKYTSRIDDDLTYLPMVAKVCTKPQQHSLATHTITEE